MADFSVYGTIYNHTYYNFPTPTASDPEHGYWETKPKSIAAGSSTTYRVADHAGCHGSQATFYSSTRQMDYQWSVCDPYGGSNSVTPKSLSPAVVTSYKAKTSGSWQTNSTPSSGHPLHVQHFVGHDRSYLLPLGTQQPQKKSFWCWAACTSMLASYYRYSGSDSKCTQCSIVSNLLKSRGSSLYKCCDARTPDRVCNISASDPELISALKSYGLGVSYNQKSPAFSTLKTALDNYQPIVIGITWEGQVTGHVAIIQGYSGDNVTVYDPEYGTFTGAYSAVISNYQNQGWVDAYFLTSYKKPFSSIPKRVLAALESASSTPCPFEIGDVKELNLLVAHIGPTDKELQNPAKSAEVGRAVFQELDVPSPDGRRQRLVMYKGESRKVDVVYEDEGFVANLRAVVDRARKAAKKHKTLHEVVYVPLPFLRMDAVIVFNPRNRHQDAVYVVPKAHEREFRKAGPYTPDKFWRSMRKRLAAIQDLGGGPEPQRR